MGDFEKIEGIVVALVAELMLAPTGYCRGPKAATVTSTALTNRQHRLVFSGRKEGLESQTRNPSRIMQYSLCGGAATMGVNVSPKIGADNNCQASLCDHTVSC